MITPATIDFSFNTAGKDEQRRFENWWFPDFEGQIIRVRYDELMRWKQHAVDLGVAQWQNPGFFGKIYGGFLRFYITRLEHDFKDLCLTRLRGLMKEGGLIERREPGAPQVRVSRSELAKGYELAKRAHPHDIVIRLLRPLFPNG